MDRFSTGETFSSGRFFVLKSSTALSLLVATTGDFNGGVVAFTGNNRGGDEDDEIRGDDADTMVDKRGGTGWKTDATDSSSAESNDSPDEQRSNIGGGGVADERCASGVSLVEIGLSPALKQTQKRTKSRADQAYRFSIFCFGVGHRTN